MILEATTSVAAATVHSPVTLSVVITKERSVLDSYIYIYIYIYISIYMYIYIYIYIHDAWRLFTFDCKAPLRNHRLPSQQFLTCLHQCCLHSQLSCRTCLYSSFKVFCLLDITLLWFVYGFLSYSICFRRTFFPSDHLVLNVAHSISHIFSGKLLAIHLSCFHATKQTGWFLCVFFRTFCDFVLFQAIQNLELLEGSDGISGFFIFGYNSFYENIEFFC